MTIALDEIRYSPGKDEVTFIINGSPGELALGKQTIEELQKLGRLTEYRPLIYTPTFGAGAPDLTVSIGPLASCAGVDQRGPLYSAVSKFLAHFSTSGQQVLLKKVKVDVRFPLVHITGSAEPDGNGGWVPKVKVEMIPGKTNNPRLDLGVLAWAEDCGLAALNPFPHLASHSPVTSDKSQLKYGILYFRDSKSFPASQKALAEKEGASAAADVASIFNASRPAPALAATP